MYIQGLSSGGLKLPYLRTVEFCIMATAREPLLTIVQQEYKHGLMPNKHPVSLLQCLYLQPLLFPGLQHT